MPKADPSLSVAERVDAACDQFEREWRAGRSPQVDDYVAAAPETDRDALRSALATMAKELQGGRAAGETSVSKESVRTGSHHGSGATVARPAAQPGSGRGAEPAEQAAVPTHIGRFEVRAVLGAGAFGRVYHAFDPSLAREVAIKVPLPETLRTPADRERFTKEAKAAAAIEHQNVCRIHEVGEHEGQPYIVMAFVPGQSLAEVLRLRKEPLPEKQVAIIIRKLALALDAAHKKGVVHRDLKPANVMFDKEKKDLVVMDFGLARHETTGDVRATQSGVVMGTPAYMSPEQASGGAKGVGPAGDIFSLGVIMYELLTHTRPFNGTVYEVISQILLTAPERPSQRRPDVDPRLEAVCLKALAKDPAQRFASMKEFATAVSDCLRNPASAAAETARARETTPDTATASSVDVELISVNTRKLTDVFAAMTEGREPAKAEVAEVETASAAGPAEKVSGKPWPKILLGAALIAAVVGGVMFFVKNDKGTVIVAAALTDINLKDKSLKFVLDGKPITAEELANPVELAPNEYVFEARRGDVIVKRYNLTVTGGRKPGITARDITPKESPKEPPKKTPGGAPNPAQTAARQALFKKLDSKFVVSIQDDGRTELTLDEMTGSLNDTKHEVYLSEDSDRKKALAAVRAVQQLRDGLKEPDAADHQVATLLQDAKTTLAAVTSLAGNRAARRMFNGLSRALQSNAGADPSGDFEVLFADGMVKGKLEHGSSDGQNWLIQNKMLVGVSGGDHVVHFAPTRYSDFHMRADVKFGEAARGHMIFRSEDRTKGNDRRSWGYAVGFYATKKVAFGFASVWGFMAPNKHLSFGEDKKAVPAGRWFTVEVIARGHEFEVYIDDELFSTVIDPAKTYSDGRVGFATFPNSSFFIRRVEIRDLSEPAPLKK